MIEQIKTKGLRSGTMPEHCLASDYSPVGSAAFASVVVDVAGKLAAVAVL